MSDDTKPDDITVSDWLMPEPVFRSTPGRTPKSVHETLDAKELTTQPGFTDEDNIDTLAPDFAEAEEALTDEPVKVTTAPSKPKKKGCARKFLLVMGMIALAIVTALVALIYFFYPVRPDPFN